VLHITLNRTLADLESVWVDCAASQSGANIDSEARTPRPAASRGGLARDGRLPGNRICRLADHLDHDVELAHSALSASSQDCGSAEDSRGQKSQI